MQANLRLQAIAQLGFEQGFFKQAAVLGIPEGIAKQAAYGDLGIGGALGQAFKFGPGALSNIANLPFSLATMLMSGGGVQGTRAALEHMPESSTDLIGGQGLAHVLHPASAAMLRRVAEVDQADPELGAKFREYLQHKDEGVGTSNIPLGITGGLRGLAAAGTLGLASPLLALDSAVSGSGGQARFEEGLEGDQAGWMRRFFDPVGYSTKNIAYELAQKDPELAAQMATALKAKFK